MQMRFRPSADVLSADFKKEVSAAKAMKGDKVKVMGFPGVYVVDEAGMKILKLHLEDDNSHKLSAMRKDTIKVF